MDTPEKQNRLAAADAMRAVESKYFLRYLIVVMLALVAFSVYWALNRKGD